MLSTTSLLAIALIAAGIGVGFSKRVLASGAMVLANLGVYLLTLASPIVPVPGAPVGALPHPSIQAELAFYSPNLWGLQPVALLQLVTNLFVHSDIWHLFGNLLFLLAFGLPFEQRVGPRRFLVIYLIGGLAASLAQILASAGDLVLLMGASGSIYAMIGAFAARYPNQVVAVPLGFFILPMRVAFGAIIYVAFDLLFLFMSSETSGLGGTAYYAHLGGAAVGILLGLLLVRPAGRGAGPVAVDLQALQPFARDAKTKDVWGHMLKNNDEPAVFQAWLDRFFRTATCPTCGHRVAPRSAGQVVCTQNHKFDVRKGSKEPVPAAAPPAPPTQQG